MPLRKQKACPVQEYCRSGHRILAVSQQHSEERYAFLSLFVMPGGGRALEFVNSHVSSNSVSCYSAIPRGECAGGSLRSMHEETDFELQSQNAETIIKLKAL